MNKKIGIAAFVFVLVKVQAQSSISKPGVDSLNVQIVQLPGHTAIGTPIGKKLSKQIGPEGEKIASDDGKIELIFPAGALLKTTEVSIQQITTTIPNGNIAYQFEPSGIQFQKPVEIIFHYSEEEAAVCPPELKFMALQDHNGKWEYMDYADWDSSTKALKGFIRHFSAMVDGNLAELHPAKVKLKVGEIQQFNLNVVQVADRNSNTPGEISEDNLQPLPQGVKKSGKDVIWKVNDQNGGSTKFGKIASDKGTIISARYTAPKVLTLDPITVKLQVNEYVMETITERWGKKGRMQREVRKKIGETSFSCQVKLYDEYKVTVSMDWKEEEGEWTDKSTFRLEIGDEVSISDIQNETLKVVFKKTKCKYVYVDESTCEGIIHVKEIKDAMVKQTETGLTKVDILFRPTVLCLPTINILPCGINKASPTTPGMRVPGGAFPQILSFEAKDERQSLSLGGNGGTIKRKADSKDIIATIEPIRN